MFLKMYCEIIQPVHKHIIGYKKIIGLLVIMHSCGYIALLLP